MKNKNIKAIVLVIAGLLSASVNADYLWIKDLTVKNLSSAYISDYSRFEVEVTSVPISTGCSLTDTSNLFGRWASETASPLYLEATDSIQSLLMLALSLNKKVDLYIHTDICSSTSGLHIYKARMTSN